MKRLDRKFNELKKKGRCAFIAYITAGDPDLRVTKKLIFELERQGVDIIELGVPFSDPLADGPVIQAASKRALGKGTSLRKIIALVKSIRKEVNIPLCLMSYYNPIYKMGLPLFTEKAAYAGVDGVIIPDLPPEEAKEFMQYSRGNKLDTIFFISPTSDVKRIKMAAAFSSGFIYYVSLAGVTGARKKISSDLKKRISLIKRHTKKPVCVGFGISKPGHVRYLSSFCDGVIVGSAIVKVIAVNSRKKDLVKVTGRFAAGLSKALK
ncbi:MAG: tryptophan synthase subunit alpha [Candidatus Omnitrophica bacterium CG11_big_fil_rev_8_21_14_0_20_42_13]|uniref:Tryptophan synthase alpha chain n=1 Tax=Candidatus Ghiorseimicrobium undicola TaxID=1974746 RepID=A0A2H0LWP7_9BACT|nr:MAG: tryptophan synthase subunit alpha [Candidatus Omnitrophica bacterium CG11_big_fil_rev_8_21_14_0_20_42_13]